MFKSIAYGGNVYDIIIDEILIEDRFEGFINGDENSLDIDIVKMGDPVLYFNIKINELIVGAMNPGMTSASILASINIEHFFNDSMLDLDLLMPHLKNIYSIYTDAAIMSADLLKPGRDVKKAL